MVTIHSIRIGLQTIDQNDYKPTPIVFPVGLHFGRDTTKTKAVRTTWHAALQEGYRSIEFLVGQHWFLHQMIMEINLYFFCVCVIDENFRNSSHLRNI